MIGGTGVGLGRALPMLPHAGGRASVEGFRSDAALLLGVGPLRLILLARFVSPGSGDRRRVPNLAFAVDLAMVRAYNLLACGSEAKAHVKYAHKQTERVPAEQR